MGDDDEGSLLFFDGSGDSVDTNGEGSLSGVSGVSLSGGPEITSGLAHTYSHNNFVNNLLGLSTSQKSGLLLSSVLWSVLLSKLEESSGSLSVKGLGRNYGQAWICVFLRWRTG